MLVAGFSLAAVVSAAAQVSPQTSPWNSEPDETAADAAPDASDADIMKDIDVSKLDWSQLSADASALDGPSPKTRPAAKRAISSDTSWSSNEKANGTSAVSVKQSLSPILVSRNGERDCLTDTAEVPFAFSFDDHEVSELIARFAAGRVFGEGPSRAEASALSWLQSSLLTSISFMMSASLASGAASAAVSSGSLFQGEVCGDTCAAADTTAARLKPATSIGSLARPNRIVKVIAQPVFQNRKGDFPVLQNYGEPRQHYLQTYPSWPGRLARRRASRFCPGMTKGAR